MGRCRSRIFNVCQFFGGALIVANSWLTFAKIDTIFMSIKLSIDPKSSLDFSFTGVYPEFGNYVHDIREGDASVKNKHVGPILLC